MANGEGQANDNLSLTKKIIKANPHSLGSKLQIKLKEIVRRDGMGTLKILPARDIVGSHGKTYLAIFFDEIHGYRTYDLFESLASDPTRPDVITWITSYASVFNSVGIPLYDFFQRGKSDTDSKMFFSWYSGDYCTDPEFARLEEPELRANPSIRTFGSGYLKQQKRRLPVHKYRRLHLNLPGSPEGAFFSTSKVLECIVTGRKSLSPKPDVQYVSFADMSGGSSDDSTLAIAHFDEMTGKTILDLVETQAGKPPFNPRDAVSKFVEILKQYRISSVTGDRYAGETFKRDFEEYGFSYCVCGSVKSELYNALEPQVNAGNVELLDNPRMIEQLITLKIKGSRIDHPAGDHDDLANSAAGAVWLASRRVEYDLELPHGLADELTDHGCWNIGQNSRYPAHLAHGEEYHRPAKKSPDSNGPGGWRPLSI